MTNISNQSNKYDPVMSQPSDRPNASVVLGQFAKIKARFASDCDEERIEALTEALQYADTGREFVVQALGHKSFPVKRAAYKLLAAKQKNERYKLGTDELLELYEAGERDFTGAELKGTIYNAKLSHANFSHANLNVDIISTDLKGVNFSGASLSETHLCYSNFSNANLSDANLMGADFSDTNLSNANLSNTNLAKVNLSNANLTDTNLSHAATWDWDELLREWYIRMGELVDSSISGIDLRTISVSNGVNFSGANLSGANLIGVDLKGVQINESTQLDSKWQLVWQLVNQEIVEVRQLSHVDLRGASLPFVSLGGANLSHADLKGANLYRADLKGADLSSANLSRTELQGANLQDANLRDANLKGAHLWRADLHSADLSSANLLNADLGGANLSDAKLEGANLDGANLQNTQLQNPNPKDRPPNDQKTWQARFKYWFGRSL
jgi:uncharacterized protein YjbI with pentapeptide repeats